MLARAELGERDAERLRAQHARLALVEHAEARIDACRRGIRAEQPVAEAVDRRDPRAVELACEIGATGLEEPRPDARPELARGALGERHDEDRADVDAALHGPDEALDDDGRLAGAGARGDEHRPAGVDGDRLLGVRGLGLDDGAHGRLTRQMGPRSHHDGHEPPFGSCRTCPSRMRPDEAASAVGGLVDERPERLVVEVVARREPRHELLASARAEHAAGAALPRQRAVEASHRLHSEQVAEDEHVERDLELELGLDPCRRVGALAALVVLDDAARGERVEVDAVDLPAHGEAAEVEPRLEPGCGALAAERDLEPPRHERHLGPCLPAYELAEVAEQALLELEPLDVGELDAARLAGHRLADALLEERERLVEALGLDAVGADVLRQPREELEESLVRHLAAQAGVDARVDRPWIDDALDEPHRGAVGEELELGDAERRPRLQLAQHDRVREPRRPGERGARAIEPAIPAVRTGDGGRRIGIDGGQRGDRAQALALGRRAIHRPGRLGELPPPRPACDVVGREQRAHVLPERARLARRAVVRRGLANEVQATRGAGARRVEEIPVGGDRIRPRDAGAARPLLDRAPGVVVEEARRAGAPGKRSLLEAEHEDDLVVPRARAEHVEHRHAARLPGRPAADHRTLERVHDVLGVDLARERLPRVQLLQRAQGRLERAQVEPARVGGRRAAEAVRRGQHRRGERPHRLLVRAARTQRVEERQRLAAQPERLRLHALRRVDGAPAEPSFEEVDVVATETRVRRPHEPVEVVASTRRARRSGAARAARCRTASGRASSRPSVAYGMPSPVNAVSSGARHRSSEGATTAMSAGFVPPRTSSRISSPTSSSTPRAPGASRKRTAPSRAGAGASPSTNSRRSRCASAGRT